MVSAKEATMSGRFGIIVLLAEACACTPAPVTPPYPGATPYDRCVADKTGDTTVQNVSHQSGTPLELLVHRMCSDPVIVEAY
jgi:hypothetical protein